MSARVTFQWPFAQWWAGPGAKLDGASNVNSLSIFHLGKLKALANTFYPGKNSREGCRSGAVSRGSQVRRGHLLQVADPTTPPLPMCCFQAYWGFTNATSTSLLPLVLCCIVTGVVVAGTVVVMGLAGGICGGGRTFSLQRHNVSGWPWGKACGLWRVMC